MPDKCLACKISGIVGDSKSCYVKRVLTEKYIGDELQPMRKQDKGRGKFGEELYEMFDQKELSAILPKVMQSLTS